MERFHYPASNDDFDDVCEHGRRSSRRGPEERFKEAAPGAGAGMGDMDF
jgi:hypothetical protein